MSVKLEQLEDFIRERIEEDKWTHGKLRDYLLQNYPGQRGFSVRSIQRFCSDNNIHRTTRMERRNLDAVVGEAIDKVSHISTFIDIKE
jgi:hypothetical protein